MSAEPSSLAVAASRRPDAQGVSVRRVFTDGEHHPFDLVRWELRTARITGSDGAVVFEQTDVEIPEFWSQTATNIVAQKYFHGRLGTPEREGSIRQLISRVVGTIVEWGRTGGYFADADSEHAFEHELCHLLLHQMVSFNSPVWFNVGIEARPQCSACFINSVRDSMDSILDLAKTEGMLFKYGSGTGSNLSVLRSSRESLAGGGTASGPVSFMRGFDSFAGVIKSGGKTRRAAKMVILNIDHPDVAQFIRCKAEEEKKAHVLISAGYPASFDQEGGAYDSIQYQNANHSVRVTDEFMRALEDDGWWETRAVTTGDVMGRYRARELMRMIAEAAWVCGDPGLQYDTTVNRWHTCKNSGRINASNPCVTGDTLVATAEGWRRIDCLVGKTVRVIGADGSPHMVTNVFPTGSKPVFELTTRAGYQVRITGDHKVWTVERGDVPVRELRLGDRVQLQGPGFGRRVLTPRLALGIGAAVGDGCLVRSLTSGRPQEMVIVTMAAGERPVLDVIAGAVNETKRAARVAGAVGRPDEVHVSVPVHGGVSRLSFSSRPVVDLFKEFAVLDQGSPQKRFTTAVLELDRPSLAAVLRGLFTADGTVANYGEKSHYVSLDSAALELLRQVQVALLSFGIKSKVYHNRRGGATEATLPDGKGGARAYPVEEVHSLRISRSSRFVFEREIGFEPSSPKAAALRALNEEVGAYHDELSDEVAAIEPAGQEAVYDLTEEATHHFVANGIVVHNCSEYMFLDDSACNLASLNLMRFVDEKGDFLTEALRHAVDVTILAQEILVDFSNYPTPRIAANSHDYRPLGLGYANLGALLMAEGIPYDSPEGRAYAAAITSLMCGEAYLQSARVAEALGPFPGYAVNREPMLEVVAMHRDAAHRVPTRGVPLELRRAATDSWDTALDHGRQFGYRNSQVTVLAPTGTIGFMMDCDTTGIEPDLALVKVKRLVGGGTLKIVNQTVPRALAKLGYDEESRTVILKYLESTGTIEGAPGLKDEHLPVFDCAFKAISGTRFISPLGHLRMMGAAQPFLSGAISKTVNIPEDTAPEEIEKLYIEAWKLGLKAVAIYRDNCKGSQPLAAAGVPAGQAAFQPVRRKLPDERVAMTHKFSVEGQEGYVTVGLYEDGKPGELFITMAKEGSTLSGVMDAFATAVSLTLQYGVPLQFLVNKFSHVRFEPAGWTNNPQIPYAKSIIDYIFRWLAAKFLPPEEQAAVGVQPLPSDEGRTPAQPTPRQPSLPGLELSEGAQLFVNQADAPPCPTCGMMMVRNGSCYKCGNCGTVQGCS